MAQTLHLHAHGNDFLLTKANESGLRERVILSEDDVLRLAQAALLLRQKILARRSRAMGLAVRSVSRATQIRLGVDAHQSEILLGMIDRRGVEITFSLALDVAGPLAKHLPVRIAQVAKSKPTRQ